MQIILDFLVNLVVMFLFFVPVVGLLWCLCLGFVNKYHTRMVSILTLLIWLFFVQVLLDIVLFFWFLYALNNPDYFIIDLSPLPESILFSLNWIIPLFVVAASQVLLLQYMKKIRIPKYLWIGLCTLFISIAGFFVITYLVFKDLGEVSLSSSVWWL